MTGGTSRSLSVFAPDGAPEIRKGDDLTSLVLGLLDLRDGDILAVTSKAVAKAEGRVRTGSRTADLEAGETLRVVARRGRTTIVRHRLGITLAAAGIDASNVAAGHVVLLPLDPDGSARHLREEVLRRTGANVAVLVTDTLGRAWRHGQTDLAIGAAGLPVLESYAGRTDRHGNTLEVTAPAVADELAGAAELVQGKLLGRPFALVRGRPDLVLAPGHHGPGAGSLVREEEADLFGFGAREAVVRALAGEPGDRTGFGEAATTTELAAACREVLGAEAVEELEESGHLRVHGPATAVGALAFAHGWTIGGSESAAVHVVRPDTT